MNSSHIFVIFYTSFSIVIPTLGAILQKKFKLRSLTNIRCVPERQGPPVWVYPGSGGWWNAFLLADGQYSPWWSSCNFQIVAWKIISRFQICWLLGKVFVSKPTSVIMSSQIVLYSCVINYQLFCHNLSLQIVLSQWLELCVTYFATMFHCKLLSSQFTWVVRQLFCLKRVFPEREASASGFPRRLASEKVS